MHHPGPFHVWTATPHVVIAHPTCWGSKWFKALSNSAKPERWTSSNLEQNTQGSPGGSEPLVKDQKWSFLRGEKRDLHFWVNKRSLGRNWRLTFHFALDLPSPGNRHHLGLIIVLSRGSLFPFICHFYWVGGRSKSPHFMTFHSAHTIG